MRELLARSEDGPLTDDEQAELDRLQSSPPRPTGASPLGRTSS